MKPLIGISTSGRNENLVQSPYYDHYFVVPDLYIDAVSRAGGVPVLLPPLAEDCARMLDRVAGVIVTGGGDICPVAYGGDSDHPAIARQDSERDEFEFTLIRNAVERKDKPVLCICRGMQVLNVALGGTMTEHIPDINPQDMHRNEDGFWTTHDVTITGESRLAAAMGATVVHTYSGHHQAVKEIAPGLAVVAHASDGIVEGLEYVDHPWLVGVQWHPEKSAATDRTQQRLFDRLVEVATQGATV